MKRSTHADRTTAWAAKQNNTGYKTKTNISADDLSRHLANESSHIETKEVLTEIETIKKQD
jgi:hypothetical protein